MGFPKCMMLLRPFIKNKKTKILLMIFVGLCLEKRGKVLRVLIFYSLDVAHFWGD